MGRRLRIMLAKVLLAAVATVVFAGTVVANSSSYSWTMDNYYVSGKNNGIFHNLSAGTLTNSGQIWAYEKLVGARTTPYTVYIEVWKPGVFIFDELKCSLTIVPSTTINLKKSYSKNCGSVPASSGYYVVVSKADFDGWHLKGTGTLTTQ